jgi:hypothetical protein
MMALGILVRHQADRPRPPPHSDPGDPNRFAGPIERYAPWPDAVGLPRRPRRGRVRGQASRRMICEVKRSARLGGRALGIESLGAQAPRPLDESPVVPSWVVAGHRAAQGFVLRQAAGPAQLPVDGLAPSANTHCYLEFCNSARRCFSASETMAASGTASRSAASARVAPSAEDDGRAGAGLRRRAVGLESYKKAIYRDMGQLGRMASVRRHRSRLVRTGFGRSDRSIVQANRRQRGGECAAAGRRLPEERFEEVPVRLERAHHEPDPGGPVGR